MASTPIDVIWIDYKGKEKVYKYDLAMGAQYTINTYFTHPWVFNSSSDGRAALLAKANGHTSPIFEASSFKVEADSKLRVEVIDGNRCLTIYYISYNLSKNSIMRIESRKVFYVSKIFRLPSEGRLL